MAAPTRYAILAFFCFLIYKVISHVVAVRKFRRFAEQHGCKEPLDITLPSFPPGWERLRRVLDLKKSGEDILDDILVPDFKDASTVQVTAFDGSHMVNTVEPANLQAMLATQFKDFEVGKRRHGAFGPLLGNSIFTSDGACLILIIPWIAFR